jgi:hypothetical protein
VPAIATLVVVVMAAIFLLVSPTARTAVANFLGIKGVRIQYGPSPTPRVNPSPDLRLGSRVSLSEAEARAGFEVETPTLEGFGTPDDVYFSNEISGGQVTLLYRPRPSLPPTTVPNVGILLAEFRGEVRRDYMGKVVGPETQIESASVDGTPGVWLEGKPHFFAYLDRNGEIQQATIRLAGNTLLWEKDGLSFRLESALSKDEAIRIAASVRKYAGRSASRFLTSP